MTDSAAEQGAAPDERLEALTSFAVGVTHDVNNVLNTILTATYLVEASAGDEEKVREYTRRIQAGVTAGTARLAPLRHFLRQNPIDPADAVEVSLSDVVIEVLEGTEATLAARTPSQLINVKHSLDAGAKVCGSGDELRVALRNVVYNAVDAMPSGGTLTVLTTARDNAALVEVQDTGVGMSESIRDRIFEPYFSTKGGRRGSGLGLSEVYGIVKRHRGTISIDSEPGRGTVVRLQFPLASATP